MVMVKSVSELFMIVLCLFAGPFSQEKIQKEIRIDLVGDRGYVDTLIVKRTGESFTVYDEMNEELAKCATILPVKDKKHVYICTDTTPKKTLTNAKKRRETINLPKSIVNFESLNLRKTKRKTLRLKELPDIRFNRSANVIYLTPEKQKWTYVVQLGVNKHTFTQDVKINSDVLTPSIF